MDATKVYMNADFEIEVYNDGTLYFCQSDECVIMSTAQALAAAHAIIAHLTKDQPK